MSGSWGKTEFAHPPARVGLEGQDPSGGADRAAAVASGGAEVPAGPIDGLLERMRTGDREAAAEFFERYGSRVRRRIRGKLSRSMRRVFDSQDLMSTVSRRLDAFVGSCRLRASNSAQLFSLLNRIADRALADKGRVIRKLRSVEGEDSELARVLLERLNEEHNSGGAELEIEAVFRLVPDATDKTILSMWLADQPHTVTAECVGMEAATVRQRWKSIRERLREALGG